MKRKIVLLVSLMLLVGGCSTPGGGLNKIRLGFTYNKTLRILGKNFTKEANWETPTGKEVITGIYIRKGVEFILHFYDNILKLVGSRDMLSASKNWYNQDKDQLDYKDDWGEIYKDDILSKNWEEKEQEGPISQ